MLRVIKPPESPRWATKFPSPKVSTIRVLKPRAVVAGPKAGFMGGTGTVAGEGWDDETKVLIIF